MVRGNKKPKLIFFTKRREELPRLVPVAMAIPDNMAERSRKRTYSELDPDVADHFYAINERPVDDISLEFFYKPHTITLLTLCTTALLYSAFTR